MSFQGRRSSLLNIDNCIDECTNDEPDSILYEPDFLNEFKQSINRELIPAFDTFMEDAADVCSKMGLPRDINAKNIANVVEFLITCYKTGQQHFHEEYDRLCKYKDDLQTQVEKMHKDLYLPAYVPDENVTLFQHCRRLKKKFDELNVVRQNRMVTSHELRSKQAKHCTVLGIECPQFKTKTDIPTEEELMQLSSTVLEMEKEIVRRKAKYSLIKEQIAKCMELTEYEPSTEFERNVLSDQPNYTETYILQMSTLHSKLEAQYAINQDKLDRLRAHLVSLYDRLDVSQDERDAFLNDHSDCKPSMMLELEVEIERYEVLKKQNIGKFIEKIKDELVVEYERCYISQDQQENFFSLSPVSDECNEELLELYERELERIKRYYEANKEILDKFQRWRQMWKELIDLEIKANDPNRFTNRGGQLLLEEKKRKTLQKGLPKLEKELTTLNEKYSAENSGESFKIFDTNLDEFIIGCWDELNTAKEVEKRERQRARMQESAVGRGRRPGAAVPTQAIVRRTPSKRPAVAGTTPTPSKMACQRSILGSARSVNTVTSTAEKSHHQTQSQAKSGIPVATAANNSGLSISEQEFEDMIVTSCPTSAKRPR